MISILLLYKKMKNFKKLKMEKGYNILIFELNIHIVNDYNNE